ncbi:Neugrin [Oryzias melastigma]|uniref:Neugrin n=1 Tax=Oryzias melastigma TaxID=30732 RepID=A0A834C8I7_ORYME|nr:Neugrin [Oryzias melastigma]
MASRALHVLCHFSRSGSQFVSPSVYYVSCRLASRGISRAWKGQNYEQGDTKSNRPTYRDDADGDVDLEDVEDKIQALIDKERQAQRTLKYHIIRRKMTPAGAPERRLTWEAIDQIRYLKNNQPEEWTVERLAESYSTTPEVIRRVLRSKFIPPPDKKTKQDAKVMARLGMQSLPPGAGTQQDKLKLPENHKSTMLPSGGKNSLVPLSRQTPPVKYEASRSPAQVPVSVNTPSPQLGSVAEDAAVIRTAERTTEEDEESWDGEVLTEQLSDFLEEIKNPPPVKQIGNDYFDAEGNFLYRI